MNTWIEHLHHPLVFAGFGLFIVGLLLRPLFRNNKKISGAGMERLLHLGMILVFILALLAIAGGIALNWKATPAAMPEKTGKSNPRQSIQQYEERLRVVEQQLLAVQASGTVTDEKERQLLEAQLQAVREKLANLQQSYAEKTQLLQKTYAELKQFKGRLPEAQLAKAEENILKGDTEAAEQVFDTVESGGIAAMAAFWSGQLAEDKLDYTKAMRQYKKAVTLEGDNPDYLLSAVRLARMLGEYSQALQYLGISNYIISQEDLNHIVEIFARHPEKFQFFLYEVKSLGYEVLLSNTIDLESDDGKATAITAVIMMGLSSLLAKSEPNDILIMNLLVLQVEFNDEQLKLFKVLTDDKKLEIASILNNSALFYYLYGYYQESESLLWYSFASLRENHNQDYLYSLKILSNIEVLYRIQGKCKEAEAVIVFRDTLSEEFNSKFPPNKEQLTIENTVKNIPCKQNAVVKKKYIEMEDQDGNILKSYNLLASELETVLLGQANTHQKNAPAESIPAALTRIYDLVERYMKEKSYSAFNLRRKITEQAVAEP